MKTIPELLIAAYGNQSTVAAQLNTQRSTVKKYANDVRGERHAIVNGRLAYRFTSTTKLTSGTRKQTQYLQKGYSWSC
ncbi:hypothetical protein ACTRMU_004581 [Yersinia enterocolitica]